MPPKKKASTSLKDKTALMKSLLQDAVSQHPQPEDEDDDLRDLFNVSLESRDAEEHTLTPRDRDLVIRMASYQLSAREIQAILQIPQAKWDKSLILQDAYMRGQEIGKATLRRLQWATAQRNPIMQIFLGKQYLEQADRHELKKPEGEPADDRQGFADKLKNIINITPTGSPPQDPDTGGEGCGEILLAHVGEGQSDCSDEGGMAPAGDDAEINE